MSSLSDLKEIVETIRRDRFPDLSPEVVVQILEVEETHVEERGPASRLVEAIVDAWVAVQD